LLRNISFIVRLSIFVGNDFVDNDAFPNNTKLSFDVFVIYTDSA